jgi:3-dehydroquinate dehydratase type I
MWKPKICASIVDDDFTAVQEAEPFVDMFEVRLDLIGNGWKKIANGLRKPWIACNRRMEEGGKGEMDEETRIQTILEAVDLGADMGDIELSTANLKMAVEGIKRHARCLVSFHDFGHTPPLCVLKDIVQRELAAGADICKVVTMAHQFEDNLTLMELISAFPQARIVAFASGASGIVSRIVSPFAGGEFTYASVCEGKESAMGQIPAKAMKQIYEMIQKR